MRAARAVRPRSTFFWSLTALALSVAAPAFALSSYSIHALPELPGDTQSDAFAVSVDDGGGGGGGAIYIVGRSSGGGVQHAVVWNASADLGSVSASPLAPVAPGTSTEAHHVRCSDGSCRAVGTEGDPGAGQSPRLWSYGGSSWSPPVSLTCPAQSPPASSDVGRARGVVLTINGSNFGSTACGSCDASMGAVGAVRRAMVWEEQTPGAWTPVPLPGLSASADASSEATVILHFLTSSGARLVAAGWAEDDLGTRQPVLWERGSSSWSVTPLPLPPGSRGGEVACGDVGRAGHAFVLDGTHSKDDGVIQAFHWRQVSGPPGQPATWEGQALSPLPGYDGGAARSVTGRRGITRVQTLAADFNVIGSSSSNGGLPPAATLWEVYPLSVETYDLMARLRDAFGNLAGIEIRGGSRGPSSGGHSSERVIIGTATTAGPPAVRAGAGIEGLPAEQHAVALVQLEPAPGLMPIGLVASLIALATIGAAVLAMRRREIA